MADQPAGADSPYLYNNPSGNVGAVFFDKAPDLLSVHLKNLEGIDEALGKQKAERAVANKVAAKLLEYKNPNLDGIYIPDTEELQKKGQEVIDIHTKLAKMDRSNPDFYSTYREAENAKQELALLTSASKDYNKQYKNLGEIVVKDKNKDAALWSKGVTEQSLLPMNQRYGEKNIPLTNFVKDLKPDLDEAINAYIKQTNPKGIVSEKTELGDGGNAYFKRKTTENITPQQIQEVSHGFRTMENLAPAFQQRWDNLQEKNPEIITALKDKYKDLDPIAREQKAQDDYMQGLLERGHYTQSKEYVFDKLSEQGRRALIMYSKGTPSAKDVSFGDAANVADFWNAKPGAEKAFMQIKPEQGQYKAKMTVDDGFGNKKEIVAPIENVIIDAGYENGKPYVVTSESADPLSVVNNGTVANNGKVFFASPRALTSYIFGKNANKVEKAFEAAGSITPDRDYDTQKFAPIGKWQNQPTGSKDVTSKQEPSWFDKNRQSTKTIPEAKEAKKQLTKKLSSGRIVYSDDNGKTWHP